MCTQKNHGSLITVPQKNRCSRFTVHQTYRLAHMSFYFGDKRSIINLKCKQLHVLVRIAGGPVTTPCVDNICPRGTARLNTGM